MPTGLSPTILIVEDDAGIAELERGKLEDAGYHVVTADNVEDAMREIDAGKPDLILLDYRLSGESDGLDFLVRVKAAGFNQPVILVTGFSDESTVIRAIRAGVRDFVTKSLEYLDYLPEAVGRVLRQVRTERQLAESEARLAGVIGSARDAVIVVEADETVSLFNPAAERIFGCPAAKAVGRRYSDFLPDSALDTAGDAGETIGIRGGDQRFPAEVSVARGEADGRIFHTLVARDITDRRAAEETLRLQDRAIRAVTQGILITDPSRPDNPIIYASPGFEQLTGYTAAEAIGRNFRLLEGKDTDPAETGRMTGAIGRAEPCMVELRHHKKDGRPFWNELSVSPVREQDGRLTNFVAVLTDVTERRRLEEQLRQSQKMEAVGQLAGGVAHDFNNMLTVINGYGDMLLQALPEEDPHRELAAEIRDAGERSAALTRQLLAFSRKDVQEPRLTDLNELVRGSERILRRLIGEDVRLAARLTHGLAAVKVDPGHVEQIIMNLAVNSRDAMPTGGDLTIETANIDLDEAYARTHPNVSPGRHVLLAVSDTGTGMTDEVKARVFEPFFTTKGVGKGTGLGLATVYGIVRANGGHVAVYSEPGHGTVFKIYLPVSEGPGEAEKSGSESDPIPKGTETILLVEDDAAVRRLGAMALRSCGYIVIEAAHGGEALRVSERHEGTIDLVVTDVVMPEVGGRELAEKLALTRPGSKVLFVSGYTDDAVVRHGVLKAEMAFLQKPFTPASLARKVRAVLDRTRQ